MRRALDVTSGDDHLNRFLMADAHLSLADDLLMVADQMSMAHSVELRVPFLDLDLLTLVSRMPSRLKVSLIGERKWLYRGAVAPLIPRELRRPLLGARARLGRKLGFTTPLDRWFAVWAARDAERELLGPHALSPAILDAAAVRQLVDAARQHGRPRARQLMSLFVLETWLRGLDRGANAGRDAASPAA
jgi:asparagine synthase (glutamine-hydrolysing)